MLIYRVENKDGEGCMRGNGMGTSERYYDRGRYHLKMCEMGSPVDHGHRTKWNSAEDDLADPDFRFAFDHLESAQKWISDHCVEILRRFGYDLVCYNVSDVYDKFADQVIYDKNDAQEVGRGFKLLNRTVK